MEKTLKLITVLLVAVTIVLSVIYIHVQRTLDFEYRKWVCQVRHTFTEDQCDFIAGDLFEAMTTPIRNFNVPD